MILVNATSGQYLEMFLFIIGMLLFSQLFNKFFGIKASDQMATQEHIRELQQELLENQDDPNELMRLQGEMAQIMRKMMSKTILPMCIRCVIFWGIFWILGIRFAGVNFIGGGYFPFYIVVSIGISIAMYYIKRLFKNSGRGPQKEEPFIDIARAMGSPKIGLSKSNSLSRERMEEISLMKQELEAKKERGELPSDLDINAEIYRIIQENIEYDSKPIAYSDENDDSDSETVKDSKKSWKQRLVKDNVENEED
jgi:hypothetical protein